MPAAQASPFLAQWLADNVSKPEKDLSLEKIYLFEFSSQSDQLVL